MVCLWYMTTHKHTIPEHSQVHAIIKKGKRNARVITRARILLLSHRGGGKDAIAETLGIGRSTVQRVRDHYREGGLDRALYDAPRPGQPPKLDDAAEAHLVALACSDPPEGSDHWTLELLQERMIKDEKVKTISTVALWKRLTARKIKPWREKNVVRAHAYA
jgi:putative transposase